jgi:hypothetical protein
MPSTGLQTALTASATPLVMAVRRLKFAGLGPVAVSLDGAMPRSRDGFRRAKGSFRRTAEIIEYAHRCRSPNGTLDPIAPGDPLYFQISSGFGASIANGIVTAIQNAVSTVSVNLTLKASDPRVQTVSAPTVINGLGSGETATFDVR